LAHQIARRSFEVNRRLGLACLTALALSTAPAKADVITSLFNTGLNASGGLLAGGAVDPHWTLTTNPDGSGSRSFVTVTDGFPIPSAWIPNQANAKWIEPTSGTADTHAAGTYTYQTSFSLTGFDPTSASIQFQVAADNRVSGVFLNGHNVGFTYSGPTHSGDAYAAFSDSFTISNPAFFKDGLNQLQFQVVNDQVDAANGCYDVQNPTGMMAVICGKACPVPEPTTYAMIGAAVGLFGLRRRRQAPA
jgi:hypothetical protein